jgi:four helix bundle protein
MSTLEKFEDITAWQKAREMTKIVYQLTREGLFAKDYGLSNQIQRATVPLMSNIAEGKERGGNKEWLFRRICG